LRKESILRIKGCAKISGDEILTYFERSPDGEITIRPFTGIQTTRAKLLTVGLGSEEFLLKNSIKNILTN
ncbi:MAG: cobalamin biosynthesis protein CobW, partial [Flavobacteriales bacterium]